MPDEKKIGAKILASLARIEAEQKEQRTLLEDIKKELDGDLDLDKDDDSGEDGNEG